MSGGGANRWTGHGEDYIPSPSSEDVSNFQAIISDVITGVVRTAAPNEPLMQHKNNQQQQQQPQPPQSLCEIVKERRTAQISPDSIAFTGFDLITLALLLVAMFMVLYTLKCICSLRIVRATNQRVPNSGFGHQKSDQD